MHGWFVGFKLGGTNFLVTVPYPFKNKATMTINTAQIFTSLGWEALSITSTNIGFRNNNIIITFDNTNSINNEPNSPWLVNLDIDFTAIE